LTVPNTFVSGTPAAAADVNQNFSATATAVNSKQNLVTGTCPVGSSIRVVNPDGTVVCQLLSFFGGNGSAGDLTVSASVDWNSAPPVNPNFASVTINAGQTLTVPAGTTIRCSGAFTNNGTLVVNTGAAGRGTNFSAGSPASSGPISAAHAGDSFGSATGGTFHDNSIAELVGLNAGIGGVGIPQAVARTSFDQFRMGGGAGAGAVNGGNGGGLVKIYCAGSIINSGAINADGATGGGGVGGGGGGIVILASRTSVGNTGTISAAGGNGGVDGFAFGASGGGGGGIVVMVSPTAPVAGTTNVSGGAGATATNTQATKGRLGGMGGGASGGNGGVGGTVSSSGVNASSAGGAAGYTLTIVADPAYMAR
jgi:hypothetical protein